MERSSDRIGFGLAGLGVLLIASLLCVVILLSDQHLAPIAVAAVGSNSAMANEAVASIIVYGLLLIAGVIGGALCGVNALGAGMAASKRLLIGSSVGAAALSIAVSLAAVAGVVVYSDAAASVIGLVSGSALILLQAGSEEIFFRGWLQRVLVSKWGDTGIYASAAVFAALHLVVGGAVSAVSVLNLFLGGLLFGLLAARYGGIASALGAHFSWNWAEQLLLGLDPNPGIGAFGSVFNLDLVGSSWWGGSSEGLNASVAMSVALAAVLAPLLLLPISRRLPHEPHQLGRAPA